MIKVSVMYPYAEKARFDHVYYREKHLPMIKQRLGASCTHYTVDKGVSGGMPGAVPPYEAMCHLHFESLDVFQTSFGPHAREIMKDVPNYTDLKPLVQVSEVTAVG